MAKKEETFMLVSLEESKAKKLAQIVSNDTCRKILEHLAKKESTETELSKELDMPISTAHYNLKMLVENGLVKAEEFHYSEKGKTVNHYSLANKFIIIAPAGTESLPSKLKKFLPAALVLTAASGFIYFLSNLAAYSAPYGITAQKTADAGVAQTAGALKVAQTEAIVGPVQAAAPDIAIWFLIGGLSALTVYFACDLIRERFKR